MARLDEKMRNYEDRRREKGSQALKHVELPIPYSRRNKYDDHREDQRYNSRHQRHFSPVVSEFRRGRDDPSSDRPFLIGPASRTESRVRISERANNVLGSHRIDGDKQEGRTEHRKTPSQDSVSKTIQSPALPARTPHSSDLRRTLIRREEEADSGVRLSTDRRPAKERLLPPTIPHSSDLRRSLSLREEGETVGAQRSADRTPARDRLSLPSNGKSKLVHQGTSTGSSRLQDIEIQYLEEIIEPPRLDSNTRPSASRSPGTLSSPPGGSSPIRTLSEDRRHVSLRLGPLPASSQSDIPIQSRLSDGPAIVTRSVARRKAGTSTEKKRYNASPLQGINLKKRRVTKTESSPKRRTHKEKQSTQTQQRGVPKPKLIPAITKKQKDFRATPSALP